MSCRIVSCRVQIRSLRRKGRIGEFVSVYLNIVQKAVYIASDGNGTSVCVCVCVCVCVPC